MKLIIGLGNPGTKYKKTRHNLGFTAVDFLHSNFNNLSKWSMNKKVNALISRGELPGEKIILAKPQTFMNLSGQATAGLANFFKIKTEDIWVIHDDFDLPLGVIRISKNASCAGHKGVKSIIETLGTKDFVRFRLGIHPIGKTFFSTLIKRLTSMQKFVLKNFSKEEKSLVNKTIKKAAQAIETALKEGVEKAMNEFN